MKLYISFMLIATLSSTLLYPVLHKPDPIAPSDSILRASEDKLVYAQANHTLQRMQDILENLKKSNLHNNRAHSSFDKRVDLCATIKNHFDTLYGKDELSTDHLGTLSIAFNNEVKRLLKCMRWQKFFNKLEKEYPELQSLRL